MSLPALLGKVRVAKWRYTVENTVGRVERERNLNFLPAFARFCKITPNLRDLDKNVYDQSCKQLQSTTTLLNQTEYRITRLDAKDEILKIGHVVFSNFVTPLNF